MRQGFQKGLKQLSIKLPCLAVLVFIIVLAGVSCWTKWRPHTYISIYEWETGMLLIQKEIVGGEIITLEYIHSADGTPVKAVFEADQKRLRLVEESYSWYGAGLEAGSGRSFTFEKDSVTVSGYGEYYFKELPIRVARTVPQKLLIGEEQLLLNDLAPGGTLLIIKIEE